MTQLISSTPWTRPEGPIPETPPCEGDVNGDGSVTVEDILIAIAQFGQSGEGDVNDDNIVDTNDLLVIIASWGPCAG